MKKNLHIAFWYDWGLGYNGGYNYFKNLISAVNKTKSADVKVSLFISKNIKHEEKKRLSNICSVITLAALTEKTIPFVFYRFLNHTVFFRTYLNQLLIKYKVCILSHPGLLNFEKKNFKIIKWIPDFQFLHYPMYFPNLKLTEKTREIKNIYNFSDATVVSSQCALLDLQKIMQKRFLPKAKAIPFASSIIHSFETIENTLEIVGSYHLRKKYFYLPNEFWAHKNHATVFKAVSLLLSINKNIQVVCSGNVLDGNHGNIKAPCLNLINELKISDQVKVLGKIPFNHVIALYRCCQAVLNPSLFEGWSTSLEESRCIGKPIILSDIPIHREQNHPDCYYFQAMDAKSLSKIMQKIFHIRPSGLNLSLEKNAQMRACDRQFNFGNSFMNLAYKIRN